MNQWENSNRNLRVVEERIGYTFRNPSLLERALTRLACTLETGLQGAGQAG